MGVKGAELKKPGKTLKRISFSFLAIIILIVDISCLGKKKNLNIVKTTSNERLRGIYLGVKTDTNTGIVVGRIAIRLIKNGDEKRVELDYPFRSKDKFRFEISSNQDGWIYILHRAPYNDPQLLWPRLDPNNKDIYLDKNMIYATQTCIVPQDPFLLTFDEKIGSELIYVIIQSQRKIPEIIAFDNPPKEKKERNKAESTDDDQSISDGPIEKIVQFSVRGTTKKDNSAYRGIVFDPGLKDSDPYIYFSSHPGNNEGFVMIEFQLRHE